MKKEIKEQLDMLKELKSTLKQSIIDKKQEVPDDKFSTLIESCIGIDSDDFKQYSTNKEMNASIAKKDDKALVYSKDNKTLGGLYNYSDNKYNHVETQFGADKEFVYNGTYLGKSGVENGTMQEFKPSSQSNLIKYLDLYNDINENGIYLDKRSCRYNNDCRLDSYWCKKYGYSESSMPSKYILDDVIEGIQMHGHKGLTELTLVSSETSNLKSLNSLVQYCSNLVKVDLSNLKAHNIEDLGFLFSYCKSLKEINLSNLDTSNVTNMGSMFSSSNITSIDLSNLDVSSVTDISSMFYGCELLTNVNFGDNWNLQNVKSMRMIFSGCNSLDTVDMSGWSVQSVTDMSDMFNINWYGIKHVIFGNGWNTSNVTNMSDMFYWCYALETIDNTRWDTSNVTNMSGLFCGCKLLKSVDVSGWNTSNVTDMSELFEGCNLLETIDVSNWDTSNVTDMREMFFSQTSPYMSVKELDVSKWNTDKVTNMKYMFRGCVKVTELDFANWNVENVTDFNCFLANCTNLVDIDVSGFNLKSAVDVEYMFSGCYALTEDSIRSILKMLPTAILLSDEDKTLYNLRLTYHAKLIQTLPEWEACVAAGWKVE